jgi:hypothetical protein
MQLSDLKELVRRYEEAEAALDAHDARSVLDEAASKELDRLTSARDFVFIKLYEEILERARLLGFLPL